MNTKIVKFSFEDHNPVYVRVKDDSYKSKRLCEDGWYYVNTIMAGGEFYSDYEIVEEKDIPPNTEIHNYKDWGWDNENF